MPSKGVATYTQKRKCVHIWTKYMRKFYHSSNGFLILYVQNICTTYRLSLQIAQTLMRHRFLWHLIWVDPVCLCSLPNFRLATYAPVICRIVPQSVSNASEANSVDADLTAPQCPHCLLLICISELVLDVSIYIK